MTTFYAFETLVYPIVPDFHSTVLVAAGASVRMSVFLPSLLLSVSAVCALYHLWLAFSGAALVPELTVLLFCFAGGDGWKRLFRDPRTADATELLNTNYAHNLGDHETFWLHSLIHFMFPQRSAMFTVAPCVVATIAIVEGARRGYAGWAPMGVAGLCAALTPMASGHSFLALCLLAAFFALATCPFRRPAQWPRFLGAWAVFALPIAAVGFPQGLAFVGRARQGGFLKLERIWSEYGGPGCGHASSCGGSPCRCSYSSRSATAGSASAASRPPHTCRRSPFSSLQTSSASSRAQWTTQRYSSSPGSPWPAARSRTCSSGSLPAPGRSQSR
jgi:hypothetical protein